MSNLLIAETPHQIVPALAAEIGLYECLLLQQLHWLIIHSECKIHDGHFWYKHTNEQWLKTLPYFQNEKRVLKTVKSLRAQSLLIAETLCWKVEKIKGDRTLWYRVNYPEVEKLSREILRKKHEEKVRIAVQKKEENEAAALAIPKNSQNGSMVDPHFGSMTTDRNGSMINKIYKRDLSSSSKRDEVAEAEPEFNFTEAFALVSGLVSKQLNIADVPEAVLEAIWLDYQTTAKKPGYGNAVAFVMAGIQQHMGTLQRSMKVSHSRDELTAARVEHINTQKTLAERKTAELGPRDRFDTSWAEGLEILEQAE